MAAIYGLRPQLRSGDAYKIYISLSLSDVTGRLLTD